MSFAELPSAQYRPPESLGTESEGAPSEEVLRPRNVRLEFQDPDNLNLQDSLEARFAQTMITQINMARQASLIALQNPALTTTETERVQNLSEDETRLYSQVESIIDFLASDAPDHSSFKQRTERRSLPEDKYIRLLRSQMLLMHGLLSGDCLRRFLDQKEKQTHGGVSEIEQENFEANLGEYMERINAMASTVLVNGEEETVYMDREGLDTFLSDNGELASMIHDIRNPLANADAYLQHAQRRPDRYQSYVPEIKSHLKRLVTTADECVKELPEELSVHELDRIFQEQSSVVLGLREGTQTLQTFSHMDEQIGDEGIVRFNTSVFKRVVENLITNSQKALRGRSGEHTFSMSVAVSADEEYYEFNFDDNGPGYPLEMVRDGFIKTAILGVHGYADKDASSEGVGMAALTRKIAQKHNGQFFPSQRGRRDGTMLPGARTTLRLPIKK